MRADRSASSVDALEQQDGVLPEVRGLEELRAPLGEGAARAVAGGEGARVLALAADAGREEALVRDEVPPGELGEDAPHQADLGCAGGVERLVPARLHAP